MQKFHHLQLFHDERVESRIREIIPQMDNWLDGTLPYPKDIDIRPNDPGVIFPTCDIDIPLRPIRNLIYSGYAEYTLLRTFKDTFTPMNLSRAVYTILRGTGKIGNVEVVPGKSIWVERPTSLSSNLIVTINKTTAIVVGLATRPVNTAMVD